MKMILDRRFSFLRNAFALAALCTAIGATPAPQPANATLSGATNAAIVWLDVPGFKAPQHEYEMRNRSRTFIPELLVVPQGSIVRFPNDDPYYHSIYSDATGNAFDIGYYGTGPGKTVTMDHVGMVLVRCHIHASMHAAIAVVDGPSAIVHDGKYALQNLAAGTYTLHAWNPDAGEKTQSVSVGASGTTLDVKL